MRTRRGFLRGLSALLLVLMPASAGAQLFVAAPADPPAIEHAELAYAIGGDAAVTWLSLRASRGPVAIVAALPPEARARAGLGAWLSSLEASAGLSVLPPSSVERCLEGARSARVLWPRDAAGAPTELFLESPDDVTTALTALGLETPSLPDAASYLVWQFPEPEGARTTRPLRIEGAALALRAAGRFPVLVSALTQGPRGYPAEAAASELEVSFTPGSRAQSDYIEQLRAWLAQGKPPILEMRARAPLFDWTIYDDAISTAPLVRNYAQRAAVELGGGDAEGCAKQLRGFREQSAPDTGACGEALDATAALMATGADSATLQRFAITSADGVDPGAFFNADYAAPPLLRAVSIAGEGCKTAPLPPLVRAPIDSGSGTGVTKPVVEPVVEVDHYDADEDVDVEVSCWGDTSSSAYEPADEDDADCSSDTSSTAASDDADCSSDTSSSTDDADCSSDTSSSTDDADSGCSSDTSSSEDSGYDGETCTGSAAPSAERSDEQRARLEAEPAGKRNKRRRPKMSLWTVGFAAFVLPFRRRKRGATRAG